jgi:hypothetical protein
MKDKTKIWTDCAECAYKHLTTAYALLTSNPVWASRDSRNFDDVPGEVFLARARIAAQEVLDGYTGNTDLVVGCLSVAEGCTDVEGQHKAVREMRLYIVKTGVVNGVLGIRASRECMAVAHIHEAVRELPEIGEGDPQGGMLRNALDYHGVSIGLNALTELIAWVRTTYEIGGKNDNEKTDTVATA